MQLQPGRNEAQIVVVDGREAVEIKLTRGKVALVDLEDWPRVSRYRWYAVKIGQTFYAQTTLARKSVYLHAIIAARLGSMVDHSDGDGLKCVRSNLRTATSRQNNQNRTKRKGCSSRYKGVSWNKSSGIWHAYIGIEGKIITLGFFENEDEAAAAYDRRARDLFGEFARLNFIYTRPVPLWPEQERQK